MLPLRVLLLTDGRPGHYHLAEGVIAALERRRPVNVRRLGIARRKLAAARVLAAGLRLGLPPAMVLRAGYGLDPTALATSDIVISAGGDTLAANVATSRLLGAVNIFCGSLRHLPPTDFGLVVSSYARHADAPRHLVTLKPSSLDPDTLPRRSPPDLGLGRPPGLAGLLIGGDSGLFHWRPDEWERLVGFLAESCREQGIRWIVSTSPRTPDAVADRLQDVARRPESPVAEFIDFRQSGPGTLPRLFAGVEAVLVTEDSSTMLSEAVCARLPVVGVAPAAHAFKDEEREYRAFMSDQGWCRSVPLDRLTSEAFLAALGDVRPLAENHLDRLAAALADRLPQLLGDAAR